MIATMKRTWQFTHGDTLGSSQRSFEKLHVGYRVFKSVAYVLRCGEYAADNATLRIDPGCYAMFAARESGYKWHSLLYTIPATCTGHQRGWFDVGEQVSYHGMVYAFEVAKAVLDPHCNDFALLDDIEIRGAALFWEGQQL